jgi:molybdopterin/thiamine biosynthesis adenylyltransferase
MKTNRGIFKYLDTNSTRANIEYLTRKFESQRIAIIGMGGTGAYILDQVSKTPVKEIHIFDGDYFRLHNAFRAPGAIPGEYMEVPGGLKKVAYYFNIYSQMHTGIIPHDTFVTTDNLHELDGFDYVFVCVDSNEARFLITQTVLEKGMTFIDAGMGVNKAEDCLIGTIRITTGSKLKQNHIVYRIGSDEFKENEYATNIQISDLNCLNAVLAVIKWKKLSGFYQDLKEENNSLYFINTNMILSEDHST